MPPNIRKVASGLGFALSQREGTDIVHHLMRLFLCPRRLMIVLFEHGMSRLYYEEHGSVDPVLSIG